MKGRAASIIVSAATADGNNLFAALAAAEFSRGFQSTGESGMAQRRVSDA